ncbi:CLUMA_CG015094, isoform A [Clunio marinus]|uniref:Epoxide hydrolase n=1 Tax=Clunio marinus TaxID=568069 RepID=A0A1J1IQ48_9DIPT|nr:CLUMA_CG015094, isoform A [Clunio marinus]
MGALRNIFFGAVTLLIAFSYQAYRDITKPYPKPDLDVKEFWGPGDGKDYKELHQFKPFKISYSSEVIKRLMDRLDDVQVITDPLEDTAFEYGFNANRLREILSYWKGEYLPKWKEREAFLNQFPQYKTKIQGLDIHFIHAKPKATENTKVYKLLLLHGWPGSVREFYDIIPLLTKPSKENIAFEVVAPSLPGYGWSQGSAKQGLGPLKMSVILRNLMIKLGFEKFYIQGLLLFSFKTNRIALKVFVNLGGDWGSLIGSNMATMFPENVLGYHSNMCGVNSPLANIKTAIASFYPSWFIEEEKLINWIYPFTPKFMDLLQESGYMHIQATKPDTIGVALQNNPVGLAAYIIEKFSTWTNSEYRKLVDGGLEKYFTLDALLDNIMIYYLTNSITTSVRIYKEAFPEMAEYNMDRVPLTIPSACAHYKYEIMHQPDFILKDKFINMVHTSYFDDGGHFAAMQLPKIMYEDFTEFVEKTLV